MEYTDGIYFDMPAEIYHSLPRLSASGIGNMLIGPPTYWADSWMNPDKKERTSEALILGAAYHVARLEPHRFTDCYIREIDPEDYPGALMNGTAIGEALADIGETKKRAGEAVMDQARRLFDAGYSKPIWHILQEKWESGRGERIGLSPKIFDQLMTDMERIQVNEQIRPLLEEGYAEVSILYTCPTTGVPMKVRIDYLAADRFVDFKSFQNSQGKRIDQFIADAFRYNRYYVQAAVYHQALEAVRAIGRLNVVHPGSHDRDKVFSLLDEIYNRPAPLDCWYVFQEKDGIPNLLARRIRLFNGLHPANGDPDQPIRKSALHLKAETDIRYAQRGWKFYREEYGDQPWPPLAPIGDLTDDDFPTFWLENDA